MAPSLLLSLNLSRKVPGHLSLSRAFSRSLLMKPMMELHTEAERTLPPALWTNHSRSQRDSPVVPEGQQVSFDHVQDSLDPQPEGERLLVGTLLQSPWEKKQVFSSAKTWICIAGGQRLTLQNLFQGINPSGFLWALVPAEKHHRHQSFKNESFRLFAFCVSAGTEQFVSQHVELLLVQASLGDGGELPAENLGQLGPLRLRRGEEELQILRRDRKRNS